jgi:hypothetical protein
VDARTIAMTNGLGRMAFGAAMVFAPGRAFRTWVGKDADPTGAKVVGAGFGVRDFALGAGLVWALQRDEPAHAWLVGAALSDAVDFTASVLAGDDIPKTGRLGVMAIAAASSVQCALLARVVDD